MNELTALCTGWNYGTMYGKEVMKQLKEEQLKTTVPYSDESGK